MDTRILCLGVLSHGPASGYEIMKAFEEGPFAHIHAASFGAIYPALSGLLQDALVEVEEQPQDKRPDKKVYSLTELGRQALSHALMQDPAPDKVRSDFLFILFYAQFLPPERLAELIDRRIAWYRDSLSRMADCAASAQAPVGAAFVRGLGQAVYQAAADYLEANRDRLLAQVALPASMVAE